MYFRTIASSTLETIRVEIGFISEEEIASYWRNTENILIAATIINFSQAA